MCCPGETSHWSPSGAGLECWVACPAQWPPRQSSPQLPQARPFLALVPVPDCVRCRGVGPVWDGRSSEVGSASEGQLRSHRRRSALRWRKEEEHQRHRNKQHGLHTPTHRLLSRGLTYGKRQMFQFCFDKRRYIATVSI